MDKRASRDTGLVRLFPGGPIFMKDTGLVRLFPGGPIFRKNPPKRETLVTLFPGGPIFMKTPPKSKEQECFEKERRWERLEKERQEEVERLEQERIKSECLKLLRIEKENAPTKTMTPAPATAQLITDNDISVASLQQFEKTGESLPTYSVNAASVHFGFDLHLDGNSHDNPDPPTTRVLTRSDLEPDPHHSTTHHAPHTLMTSDLEPDPHHSNTTLPVPPTPTTSELEPDLP